jgi:hypothetical protein
MKPMPSLRELQRSFVAATLFGDVAALAAAGVIAKGLDAAARLGVYRNNILGNYRKALAASYPVVLRLVGAPFFNAAVDAFVRAHPSTRGDVNRYGGELARFLAAYPPARGLGYLPDVARLEWALDQAGIAADAQPLDLAALGSVPAGELDTLRFVLHPSAHLIASPYPILHIWRVNQPDYDGEVAVDLGEGGDALLVLRTAQGVSIEPLAPGEHALLAAFGAGATLATAAKRAAMAEPAFDLTASLGRHVAAQAIVAFRIPPTPKTGSQG